MLSSSQSCLLVVAWVSAVANGFTVVPNSRQSLKQSTTAVFGLFDGVKNAFTAPTMEGSSLGPERETPIDRWMGWSVDPTNPSAKPDSAVQDDFVDSMDEASYVAVELPKPMGIVFEENDEEYGGVFVQSLKEDGVAAKNGVLQPGDQLILVGSQKVYGLPFDDALGAIIDATDEKVKLVVFRGDAKQFYGPTGASQEWMDAFVAKGGVKASVSA